MRRRQSPLQNWPWWLLGLLIAALGLIEAYRFVPVPLTPLMVLRLFEGAPLHKTWVPLRAISPVLQRSVIAAEDNLFCNHDGFDWAAINKVYQQQQTDPDAPLRGASTISQQTAKNVFLWPGRSWLRKGLEAPLTVLIENLWGKKRILEVYLNVAEFGPGIYGAEAAARYYFRTSAKNLTPRQAALIAAVLPNPRQWSPTRPGPYVRYRAARTLARAYKLGPLATCLR